MTANSKYKSGFAKEIEDYIAFKRKCGLVFETAARPLAKFDRFCVSRGIDKPVFTKADADAWTTRMDDEANTTYYGRVNAVKNFLNRLALLGYDVQTIRDVRFKPTDFQPHIYSPEETRRYFEAVDSFSSNSPKEAIELPVLFRILYCCGTRITETLSIKKKDVNLKEGIIHLRNTKGGGERQVVVGEDLRKLLCRFADKCFYALKDENFIFATRTSRAFCSQAIDERHRIFLARAGIPYRGGHYGPRIHDWRHTFAVNAFKRLAESGLDMYVALPILSAYLGHKSVRATERYVRLTFQLYPEIEEKYGKKVEAVLRGYNNGNN